MVTNDDMKIIGHICGFRYLQSGQLARLIGRGVAVTRRRCRELARLGLVARLQGAPMEEVSYALTKAGYELAAGELGLRTPVPFSATTFRAKPADGFFRKHELRVNDVRIHLELACVEHPEVALLRTIPEFELKDPAAKQNHEKFLLWHRIEDGRKVRTVRPDACFLLGRRGVPGGHPAAFFLELDRGTQPMRRIEERLEAYRLFFARGLHQTGIYQAAVMRVLFVVDEPTNARIFNIRHLLKAMAGRLNDPQPARPFGAVVGTAASVVHCFRFARFRDLSSETILDEPVWESWDGERIRLFNPPAAEAKREVA